jgi:ABC-type Mn2+/Zn2+ transport system ATPase subunit
MLPKFFFRALYASNEASIFLLDDPLSAVDPNVSKEIFTKYILGFLKNQVKWTIGPN